MHANGRMLLIALGLACAWGANAQADMCMVLSGGGTAVAKGFKLEIPAIPQQNTCQPYSGFEDGGAGAFTAPVASMPMAGSLSSTIPITTPSPCAAASAATLRAVSAGSRWRTRLRTSRRGCAEGQSSRAPIMVMAARPASMPQGSFLPAT